MADAYRTLDQQVREYNPMELGPDLRMKMKKVEKKKQDLKSALFFFEMTNNDLKSENARCWCEVKNVRERMLSMSAEHSTERGMLLGQLEFLTTKLHELEVAQNKTFSDDMELRVKVAEVERLKTLVSDKQVEVDALQKSMSDQKSRLEVELEEKSAEV